MRRILPPAVTLIIVGAFMFFAYHGGVYIDDTERRVYNKYIRKIVKITHIAKKPGFYRAFSLFESA